MINQAVVAATFAAAIGCGLVAGIFFAFSSFVMGALGRIPPEQGINAMQSINVVVINRSFFLAFFGTAALCLALFAGAWFWWGVPAGKFLLLGSVVYLTGTIGVTMVFNVPLNNALAAVVPASTEGATLWAHYLDRWTTWNTVRTVAPTVSMALFIAALISGR
ncbi:MAG: anthrone oxygenase family protein [Reyranella sp.]